MESFIIVLLMVAAAFLLWQGIKCRRDFFSADSISKSLMVLGVLACVLLLVINVMVMFLRSY